MSGARSCRKVQKANRVPVSMCLARAMSNLHLQVQIHHFNFQVFLRHLKLAYSWLELMNLHQNLILTFPSFPFSSFLKLLHFLFPPNSLNISQEINVLIPTTRRCFSPQGIS